MTWRWECVSWGVHGEQEVTGSLTTKDWGAHCLQHLYTSASWVLRPRLLHVLPLLVLQSLGMAGHLSPFSLSGFVRCPVSANVPPITSDWRANGLKDWNFIKDHITYKKYRIPQLTLLDIVRRFLWRLLRWVWWPTRGYRTIAPHQHSGTAFFHSPRIVVYELWWIGRLV